MKVEQRLHERLARWLNAPSTNDIALVKYTSEALSFVAFGLDWKSGDQVECLPRGPGIRFSPHFYAQSRVIDEIAAIVRQIAKL